MTSVEYGKHLAGQRPPLTPEQIEQVARTFVAVMAATEAAA